MADGQGPPDPQSLARDWITIWQSELAALATDREMHEAWLRLVGLWADAANAAARLLPGPAAVEPAGGRTGAVAAAGAAPAMAAPDPRDAAIERLAARVEELERRLAERDSRPGSASA
jgi:hypothetical protein